MKKLMIVAICILGTSVMVNAETMSTNLTHLKEVVITNHTKKKPVKKAAKIKKEKKTATPKTT
ncbi:hypothetical protein [Flavobacterium sp. 7A]|uniref:hypothetical protein n=1 Tax=Flavobacterium sp. 7A TaxID=2940571 RepID=UPI002227E11F|nr:hypothetical protein [Flavobacterium sp. 7A]MCW2118742.1 hypothetical protein [Flavobacterium sp. 7A]